MKTLFKRFSLPVCFLHCPLLPLKFITPSLIIIVYHFYMCMYIYMYTYMHTYTSHLSPFNVTYMYIYLRMII